MYTQRIGILVVLGLTLDSFFKGHLWQAISCLLLYPRMKSGILWSTVIVSVRIRGSVAMAETSPPYCFGTPRVKIITQSQKFKKFWLMLVFQIQAIVPSLFFSYLACALICLRSCHTILVFGSPLANIQWVIAILAILSKTQMQICVFAFEF